jgi:hypothetical protein
MARLVFTQQLRRFTATPEIDGALCHPARGARRRVSRQSAAARLRARRPGALRANVVAFIDGRRSRTARRRATRSAPDSEVHVMQALSGG